MMSLFFFLFPSSTFSTVQYKNLPDVVNAVKKMIAEGKPKGEIAQFINKVVDDRIICLNRDEKDERGRLGDKQYTMLKESFEAWSKAGVGVDAPYASAHWVWQNKIGHCQENAHTVYHILMMALESGDQIGQYKCDDHIYVIWGVPKDWKGEVTIHAMNSWKDAYVIDPWLGVSKPTSAITAKDEKLTQGGKCQIQKAANWTYKNYKGNYDRWLKKCDNFSGSYGIYSDTLIVTEVSKKSDVYVGQSMKMRPAGALRISQSEHCGVLLLYRGSEIGGNAIERIAVFDDVLKGDLIYASLSKIPIGGEDKMKVILINKNSKTGTIITREGILTKVK